MFQKRATTESKARARCSVSLPGIALSTPGFAGLRTDTCSLRRCPYRDINVQFATPTDQTSLCAPILDARGCVGRDWRAVSITQNSHHVLRTSPPPSTHRIIGNALPQAPSMKAPFGRSGKSHDLARPSSARLSRCLCVHVAPLHERNWPTARGPSTFVNRMSIPFPARILSLICRFLVTDKTPTTSAARGVGSGIVFSVQCPTMHQMGN